MTLDVRVEGDRCIAKHESSALIFAVGRRGNSVRLVARHGGYVPKNIFMSALSEAKRLLIELPAKWTEETRELNKIFHELRTEQHEREARIHEDDLLKDIPDHDR